MHRRVVSSFKTLQVLRNVFRHQEITVSSWFSLQSGIGFSNNAKNIYINLCFLKECHWKWKRSHKFMLYTPKCNDSNVIDTLTSLNDSIRSDRVFRLCQVVYCCLFFKQSSTRNILISWCLFISSIGFETRKTTFDEH